MARSHIRELDKEIRAKLHERETLACEGRSRCSRRESANRDAPRYFRADDA